MDFRGRRILRLALDGSWEDGRWSLSVCSSNSVEASSPPFFAGGSKDDVRSPKRYCVLIIVIIIIIMMETTGAMPLRCQFLGAGIKANLFP